MHIIIVCIEDNSTSIKQQCAADVDDAIHVHVNECPFPSHHDFVHVHVYTSIYHVEAQGPTMS